MNIDEVTEKITDLIYKSYGSDSGYLFGIEPKHKKAIESLVNITIKWFIDFQEAEKGANQ